MTEIKDKRNTIVENNLGLVHSCANKFRGRGVDYDDLYQAGCLGLIKAADNFDPERGFNFSTYAVPVILGEIKRIFRDGGSLKVGRALKEKSRKVLSVKEEVTVELGREPSITELSEKLGIEPTETAMLLNAALPVQSLTVGEDGENQLDIPVNSPENSVSDLIALRQVLDSLDDKDRKMLQLRYFSELTQSETAKRLGMTQVQVSRREKMLLMQIRKKLNT